MVIFLNGVWLFWPLVIISFSTRESLCSQPIYLDDWHISAHAGSICCWAMAVSVRAQAGTRPTAFQHSKETHYPPPPPPSLQGATSPRPPSQTSTSAPSTGLWCLDSAACCRYCHIRLIPAAFLLIPVFQFFWRHCLSLCRVSCCVAPALWSGTTLWQIAVIRPAPH